MLALSVILLSACGSGSNAPQNQGSAPPTGESGTTTEGQTAKVDAATVYQTNCASCHGQNLEGNVGPALNHIGATLSKDQILSTIKNGKGIMPANIIQGEEADAVASWLEGKK